MTIVIKYDDVSVEINTEAMTTITIPTDLLVGAAKEAMVEIGNSPLFPLLLKIMAFQQGFSGMTEEKEEKKS